MSLKAHFNNAADAKTFADRYKLAVDADATHVNIDWHLLSHAKKDPNLLNLEQVDQSVHEFIIQGNPNNFSTHATVKQDLGGGFYLVESDKGADLHGLVDSIDINSQSMKFLGNVSTIESFNTEDTTLDPTSAAGQWHRIRVASSYRPLLPSYSLHEANYLSKPEVYIMDTGINFDHPEFSNPATEKENFYTLPVFNGNFSDDVGHGTAVASMVAGVNLGITPHVKLRNVKIGSATHSANLFEVGMAIDAIMKEVNKNPNLSRIVNMSWGIARSAWLDSKVQSLLDAGVTVVCAAGNSGISVEEISPAGLDSVITVASIDRYDIPSGFNNISPSDTGLVTGSGLSLDIFAPGENVMVAIASGGYGLSSGTSFACPLVVGVAAVIAALNSTPWLENQLKAKVLSTATDNAILFEDEKFTEDQNKIAHVITSDPNGAYTSFDITSYLGRHSDGQPIVANLNSIFNTDLIGNAFDDENFTFAIEFFDPSLEAEYGHLFNMNDITGELVIDFPNIVLPEEVKLKMVDFRAIATSERIKMVSHKLFFFQVNPAYEETIESDITLALSETNSISFYAVWNQFLK